MSRRIMLMLPALAGLVTAPVAQASTPSLTVEGFAGYQNLRFAASSVSNAVSGREGTLIVGGDALVNLGGLGLGASVDKTASGSGGQPWAGALLAGFLLEPADVFRLEILGELGRRGVSFDNIFNGDGQTFVGFRPGVSIRIVPTIVRIGVSGLVRWPTSHGDFGSPDYGIIGRLGFEIP
jgi:hypothetical protein